MFHLDDEVRSWKAHLRAAGVAGSQDLDELESHLLDSVEDLGSRGLNEEEAFLLSVKRLGDSESLKQGFESASTETVWKQLLVPAGDLQARQLQRRETLVAFLLALAAGILAKLPALSAGGSEGFFLSLKVFGINSALYAFPAVAVFFLWKRRVDWRVWAIVLGSIAAVGLAVNLLPFEPEGQTIYLTALHLPIFLWFLVSASYVGKGWNRPEGRLDFVRFSGELFLYAVLICLGGMVLIGLAIAGFSLIDVDAETVLLEWGAIIGLFAVPTTAAYLVERKKSLIEGLAPVLARLFTPLFLATILGLLGALALGAGSISEDRDFLIWFDILLALVLGLVLYTISARSLSEGPGIWDWIVLALLASALLADSLALGGILSRLGRFGFTANRTAALGENLLLFGNLVILLVCYGRFLAGKLEFRRLVGIQMRYLPVYAVWALAVSLVFPLLFRFG